MPVGVKFRAVVLVSSLGNRALSCHMALLRLSFPIHKMGIT